MDGSMVLHFDEKESEPSNDDTLARRLKNRERQRRYRERKRHESERNALIVHQSTPRHHQQTPSEFRSAPMPVPIPLQVEIPVNVSSRDILTRVHCQRDWKKDARSAHLQKKLEIIKSSNGPDYSEMIINGGSSNNSLVVHNNGTERLISSRRHWKAEARNKKSSE